MLGGWWYSVAEPDHSHLAILTSRYLSHVGQQQVTWRGTVASDGGDVGAVTHGMEAGVAVDRANWA